MEEQTSETQSKSIFEDVFPISTTEPITFAFSLTIDVEIFLPLPLCNLVANLDEINSFPTR